MMILKGMIELGVKSIEFFSPVVNGNEKDDFLELKEYARTLNPSVRLLAHCRCHPDDIEQAISAGFDGLNLFLGVSEYSQNFSHGMTMTEIIRRSRSLIKSLRKNNPAMYIRFSGEDCFRTKLTDVYKVYDEVGEYVDTFGMPDTVGIATPELVRKRVRALKKRYPTVDLECHFHNDRGLSVINAVTAIQSGASYIDTSVWGMAERSGITSVTALLFNLYQDHPELCESFNLEVCYPLNVLMGSILKYHVPYNEPVSVTNRTHTAGVHQKAVLNNKIVYEAMDLRKFGVTKNQLLLGPLSGWNLISYFLREFKNYDISKDQAREITKLFKKQIGRIGRMQNPESILDEILENYMLKKFPVEPQVINGRIEHLS